MKEEIVTILILNILVIGGLAVGDDIEYKSHTADNYDITTIYKMGYNAEEERNQKPFNNIKCTGCYDANIHLRTNAIGMPIEFNGLILSSDKKSLEFIADSKYPTNISTQNQIEYSIGEWTISKLNMLEALIDSYVYLQRYQTYDLLLWRANNNAESFKIKWKQRNSIKMCISMSYLLEDQSKCTFSMYLTNEDSLDKQVIYSYDHIKESKTLKTVLFKSNDWPHTRLYENKTYSLNFKLEKKSSEVKVYNEKYRRGYYYENEYIYKTEYASGCKIGIKRIAQCTDEYGN